jgi:D-inositol-3-phosphate glycosyltransferase
VILFLGLETATGFARVLDSIASHLPYPVQRLDIDASGEEIDALSPELILVLDEPWRCAKLAPLLCDRYPTIFYGAADGEGSVTPEIAALLARADCYVAFQSFGRAIVERAGLGTRIETIPHGIDSALFHPLDRQEARRAVLGDGLDDAFVVLNANRNQPFKRIDLTVEGFALFARDKPENVKLCLHMATRTPAPGEVPLADRFGIRDRLLLSERSDRHPSVSDERLNLLYNACDAGLNTSEKEGWGLIAFEHGATRAAQVVPKHSACAELWEGAAVLVEPAGEDSPVRNQHAGRTVTVEGVAAALERLYRDSHVRQRLADAAYERATEPRYAWKNIAAQWDALFREVMRTSPTRSSSA